MWRKGGRKITKKGGKVMRRGARRTNLRRKGNVAEWASAKQTLQLKDDPMNQILQLNQIRLAQFDRLTNIAQNYQFFRFTKVEMKFKPYSDTYIPQVGNPNPTAASIPYLFYLIDKGNVLEVANFDNLRDAGCKPIRFDDKTVNVNWKPCVLQYAQDYNLSGQNPLPVMKKQSPWLATSQNAGNRGGAWVASAVDHTGILYGVEQDITIPDNTFYYGVEITVHAQFKKPLNAPGQPTKNLVVEKELVRKHEEVVV